MTTPKFTRTPEDFVCQHCGANVAGNGYTNHCPQCLWSKHVDVNPGDRAADCDGLMKPIAAEQQHGEWRVLQRCVQCGFTRANKILPEDNFEIVIKLSSQSGSLPA